MPIYEFECLDCGHTTEILMASTDTDLVICGSCGSRNLKKLLSVHAPIGSTKGFPESAADSYCGAEGPATTCEGLGSCCGRS